MKSEESGSKVSDEKVSGMLACFVLGILYFVSLVMGLYSIFPIPDETIVWSAIAGGVLGVAVYFFKPELLENQTSKQLADQD